MLARRNLLWGSHGVEWTPGAPLKDFSHAGYCGSDAPIPDFPVGVNVRDFGAAGDGATDDTAAFARAVAACPKNAAVFVPDGTYAMRGWLRSRTGSTEGEVYWNVRTARSVPYPEPQYHNLVVGLHGNQPASRDPGGAVYESIPPGELVPANLFDAQLALRQQANQPTSKK